MAPSRKCAGCKRWLPKTSFSANQLSKSLAVSRCSGCVHGHPSDSPAPRVQDAGRHSNSSRAQYTREALEIPFEQGSFRYVAKGTYVDGERAGESCVCKWFIPGEGTNADVHLDLRVVDKSREIVNHFNRLQIVDRPVVINIPEIWESEQGATHGGIRGWPAGAMILEEPFIHGYEKFNSSSGWANDAEGWPQAMQALSHFSFHVTGGNHLLCDLQGGIYEQHVVLSDPVIHSWNRAYGNTDWGREGISGFFSQHKCNRYCRDNWALPAKRVKLLDPIPHTARRHVPAQAGAPVGTARLG